MNEQRQINLHINAAQQTQIIENLQAHLRQVMEAALGHFKANPENAESRAYYKRLDRINPRDEYYAAIGYLSTWNMTHAVVDIYPESHRADNTDFIARYERADGTTAYIIAAIWHDDHYGFHS